MDNSTALVWILAFVAFGTVIQAVALTAVFLSMRRIEERALKAEAALRELQPRLARVGRALDTLADWTEQAAEKAPQLARELGKTVERAKQAARLSALMLVKPLRPLGALAAVWKGVSTGLRRYRSPRRESPPVESL